jgi:hypothetical protein
VENIEHPNIEHRRPRKKMGRLGLYLATIPGDWYGNNATEYAEIYVIICHLPPSAMKAIIVMFDSQSPLLATLRL